MADVTLYHYPLSYNSQIVRLVLSEMKIDWEGHMVDIGPAHQNYAPWYMKLNEHGFVPILKDGDEVVSDTRSIVRHLVDKYPSGGLIPEDAEAREYVDYWVEALLAFPERDLTHGIVSGMPGTFTRADIERRKRILRDLAEEHPDLADVYEAKRRDVLKLEKSIADPTWVENVLFEAERMLDHLEERMAGREWLVDSGYSLGDLAWSAFLARLEMLHLARMWKRGTRPNVEAYYERVRARPSFRAAKVYRHNALSVTVPSLFRAFGIRITLIVILIAAFGYGIFWLLDRFVLGAGVF